MSPLNNFSGILNVEYSHNGAMLNVGAFDLLTSLHFDWAGALDSEGCVCFLVVDVAGAVDKVSHVGLLRKLGVAGSVAAF